MMEMPPAELVKAAEQFNAQQFWECHETLEQVWLVSQGPTKLFYQGLIQVAAGFHHIMHCNAKGATSLLTQGLEKLNAVKHEPMFNSWMQLNDFITTAETALKEVESLGSYKIQLFCPGKIPQFLLSQV